jgi:hypothetical protein
MQNKAYNLLVEKAKELESDGFLEIFKTDLTKHDRLALDIAGEGTPFLWAIRETGTWILDKRDFTSSSRSERWKRSCYDSVDSFYTKDERYKVFYYDGKSEQLLEMKDSNSCKQILREWERVN